MKEALKWSRLLSGCSPQEILAWALEHFGADKVALASTLGAEDQVLTDILLKLAPKTIIFTLATGRLPQETLDCMKETERKYSFKYRVYHPETKAVKKMVAEKGEDVHAGRWWWENQEQKECGLLFKRGKAVRKGL